MKRTRQPALEIIVRRGALRRFDLFKRKASHLPVKLSWDRRIADSSSESPQGVSERRGRIPFTWEAADFVLVEREED